MMIVRFSPGPLIVGNVLALLLLGLQSGRAETVTGTGFAVTFDGVLITNYHVVSECQSRIRARIAGSLNNYYFVTVIARDAGRDLAALRLQLSIGQGPQRSIRAIPRAIFRKGPAVQQGETAITYGFPLTGLLATSGNLTSGYVSALSGLGNDRNFIQISTPVQQGNSGGPLYDSSGHIIGVVVAKLSALNIMLATGDVPQNVNFAIKLDVVRRFLQQNHLQIAEEQSTDDLSLPEIGQKARLTTYLITCRTQKAAVPAPSVLRQPPVSPKYTTIPRPLIPVDLSKLKFSDIRRPFPLAAPQTFDIAVSNAGSDRVTELTIGFRRVRGRPCTRSFEDYDGFKKFRVNLLPGDSVRLTGEFSAQAQSFCIIRAIGLQTPTLEKDEPPKNKPNREVRAEPDIPKGRPAYIRAKEKPVAKALGAEIAERIFSHEFTSVRRLAISHSARVIPGYECPREPAVSLTDIVPFKVKPNVSSWIES